MIKRPDIQIARAVAVLAVLGFHIGAPGFRNGFLGVDIFFVISGFLMGILYVQIGVLDFYKRRLTRLYPSLLVVTIFVLMVGLVVLQPFEVDQLSTQIIGGVLGFSNIAYWSQDSYFQPNRFRPLLNLWSLGVEIQFYLLFPFLLFLKRKSKFILPLLALFSFLLCILILHISPKTSFFLLPTRLWEFLTGMLIAYINIPNFKRKTRRLILILPGSLFIFAFLLPINSDSTKWVNGHPGLNSFLIVIATALILKLHVTPLRLNSFLTRIAIRIGDISYEVYLVHFPILVFSSYLAFSGTVTEVKSFREAVVALFLIFSLSFILFKISKLNKVRKPMVLGAGVSILCLILSSTPISKAAWQGSSEISYVTSFAIADRSPYRCGKIFRILHPRSELCLISGNYNRSLPNILLFGNSHADMIKSEVIELLNNRANTYFWVQNSPFSLEIDRIRETMRKYGIEKVLIHSSTFNPGLNILEELLVETPNVEYVMLGSVPTFTDSLPKIIYESAQGKPIDFSAIDLQAFLVKDSLLGDYFYEGVDSPNFRYISTQKTLCKNSKCEWRDEKNNLYYFDTDHLTLTGAHALREPISRSLDLLLGDFQSKKL
jgi:peptidoglycan/LPS O-acetylase OafA/YrhL